jgi:hypothetical protein
MTTHNPVVPEGTRLVLISEELARLWGTRTESGDLLTFEWGEPDGNGWYTPTFTAHADDNPTQALRDRVAELEHRIRDFAETWHVASGHDGFVRECGWSTCLGLLTGHVKRGADLDLAEIR